MDFILDIDLEDPHNVLDALVKSFEKSDSVVDKEGKEYINSILRHLLIPAQVSDDKIRYFIVYLFFMFLKITRLDYYLIFHYPPHL